MTEKTDTPQTASSNTDPNSSQLDAHGHNPADYDWVPILRKRRKDGWTPEKQRGFIGALADGGVVIDAARSVGMSDVSAYRLRRAPGGEGFAAAWDAALNAASARLIDVAFDRAINGVDDEVLDRDGNHVYTKRKYSDRLLMFLLRAHAPGRYRHANRDTLAPKEELPVQARSVAEAIKLLGPEPVTDPEHNMAPEALEDAMEIANLMEGKIPGWHERADGLGDDAEKAAEVKHLSSNRLQTSESKEKDEG